jgi:FkbM family methyltransferase
MLCGIITPPGMNDSDAICLKENILSIFYDKNTISLLQIGANDGISADPIYDLIKDNKKINAYLVEPQKDAFKILTNNYNSILSENRINLLNYAITNKNDEIKLYKNNAKNGTDGHSSLMVRNIEIIDNIVVADFNENIYELVDGITFDKLKELIHINNFDVVVIDTEGYDVELIKLMFNSNLFPKILFFETPGAQGYIPDYENNNKYTINNTNTFNFVENLLIENNYIIKKLCTNWLCIKSD